MNRNRYKIPVIVLAVLSAAVSFPASADITVRFGYPGYSFNQRMYNYNPGIRYYGNGTAGYLTNRSYLSHGPAWYRSYSYNRPLPSTHVYGYYPYNSYYGYRNQTAPAASKRYNEAYKRGYEQGFADGNQRHHNRHEQYFGKARKRD